ncbi:hypothetical protein MKZ38_007558 [Zalerion maritima]|uniref:Uncharacterized protein n=1 Tax=Zalerion maritima TaxID=339359 RepID=A0AAD5RHJ5_9PEZI|nr:hypothetical protein MKZ38_007558 [Zalerion maritima]
MPSWKLWLQRGLLFSGLHTDTLPMHSAPPRPSLEATSRSSVESDNSSRPSLSWSNTGGESKRSSISSKMSSLLMLRKSSTNGGGGSQLLTSKQEASSVSSKDSDRGGSPRRAGPVCLTPYTPSVRTARGDVLPPQQLRRLSPAQHERYLAWNVEWTCLIDEWTSCVEQSRQQAFSSFAERRAGSSKKTQPTQPTILPIGAEGKESGHDIKDALVRSAQLCDRCCGGGVKAMFDSHNEKFYVDMAQEMKEFWLHRGAQIDDEFEDDVLKVLEVEKILKRIGHPGRVRAFAIFPIPSLHDETENMLATKENNNVFAKFGV